jgi:hypothetical protein
MKLNQCNYNQVEAYGLVPDGRLGKLSGNGGRNTMFISGDGFFLFLVGTVDFPFGSYWKSLKPASGMSDLGRNNNPNGIDVISRPQVRWKVTFEYYFWAGTSAKTEQVRENRVSSYHPLRMAAHLETMMHRHTSRR